LAKHILNTGNDDLDFVLIGISTYEDQYGIVNVVDRYLGTSFYLSDQIPYNLKEGRLFKFSLFRFLDSELGLDFYLISNLSDFEEPNVLQQQPDLFAGQSVDERVRLIKELPKVDFFLLLKGEDLSRYQHQIIEKLKACEAIRQVQAIEAEQLPSKKNLIF
jgi:hypothetical protein